MLFLWGFLAGVAATVGAGWLLFVLTPDEPDEAETASYDPLA